MGNKFVASQGPARVRIQAQGAGEYGDRRNVPRFLEDVEDEK
jgi:hypothetical protein